MAILISMRKTILLTTALLVVEWTLFKLAYPYPDFILDSYYYIGAARDHLDINIWPIGYSKFLWLFHQMTHSDTALVSFQFFFLEAAALYLYLTITNRLQLGKGSRVFIYLLFFCNPMIFYFSNCVLSDTIFAGLSLIWFTELLRSIWKPLPFWRLWIQALCIGIAFTFRYQALYYPLITAAALILSKMPVWKKVAGTVIPLVFMIPFIIFSKRAGEKVTGAPIYSFLSGWQLANNALYMRGEIDIDTTHFPNAATAQLDSMSRVFFRHQHDGFQEYLHGFVGNFFIQTPYGPLKMYMGRHYSKDDGLAAWGKANIPFGQYGSYLIRNHPFAYFTYYLLPNSKSYFVPPLSDIQEYNYGKDSISETAQKWFDYPKPVVHVISHDLQFYLVGIFSLFFLGLNVFFAIQYTRYRMIVKKMGLRGDLYRPFMFAAIFFILNAIFTIVANGPCLRYQIVPLLVFVLFSCMLVDALENLKRLSQAAAKPQAQALEVEAS